MRPGTRSAEVAADEERLLVHHWDNALLGARAVAAHLLDGSAAAPYDPAPTATRTHP
ncbi:hypothetical protein ABZ770_14320 [Streptomyces sp. NPDC006654]|uniref:hypothetical protein n=1 Tax=unclassified Streptomyces TaxID=2593676 RepID=UPI0033CC1741